jgi:Amidase
LPVDNAADGNTVGPGRINDVEVDPLIGWCLTYFVNFSGHPAASIPAGLAEGRLPVGMQLIGRRYADADVLAASAAFERLRPWQDTYQLCAGRPPQWRPTDPQGPRLKADQLVGERTTIAEREPTTSAPTVGRDLGERRSAQRFPVVPYGRAILACSFVSMRRLGSIGTTDADPYLLARLQLWRTRGSRAV